MESTERDIIASTTSQVRKPTLRDRLLYSRWYLEACVVVDEFAASRAALTQQLQDLLEGGGL